MKYLLGTICLSGLLFYCGFSYSAEKKSFSDEEGFMFEIKRKIMVETQIKARGINDARVLDAMEKVKRHLFIPQNDIKLAYSDTALPIDNGQTISQPYIVALMTELANIRPGDKVLEIGTGSGYQAAILCELTDNVYSIEIIKELADKAKNILKEQGYNKIKIKIGDGYLGWADAAPFNAIIVTAAPPEIPKELINQLKIGGRMIIPLGEFFQELYVITKTADGDIIKERVIPVRFVPMIKTDQTKTLDHKNLD